MARKSFDEVDIGELGLCSGGGPGGASQRFCMERHGASHRYPTTPVLPCLISDKSGSLDQKELFIALLKLYDKLNGMLPCRVTVPDLGQVIVGVVGASGVCVEARREWL